MEKIMRSDFDVDTVRKEKAVRGKQQLLVILLIGLLLLVIAIPVPRESDKEQEETKRETSVGIRSGNGTGAEDTLVGQYEAYLEKTGGGCTGMCGGGRKDGSGDHLEIIRAESHRKGSDFQ